MKNLFIIFGLLVNSVYGQMSLETADSLYPKFHPELKKLLPVNHDSVQIYFTKMINDHRISNGVSPLVIDTLLKKGCDDQMYYILKVRDITHEQPSENKKHSWDRAKFYGVIYDPWHINENVLWGGMQYKNMKHYDLYQKYKSNSLSYMYAKNMFDCWRGSKGHNENMLNPNWEKFYFNYVQVWDGKNSGLSGVTIFASTKSY
jgi:uncharacterized protein YkwD